MDEQFKQSLRKLMWFGITLYVIVMSICFFVWAKLPVDAQIPMHYGLNFEPDGYGHKTPVLLGMPNILLLLTVLFVFLPRFEPRQHNLIRSMKAYLAVGYALLIFFSALVLLTAFNALEGKLLQPGPLAILLGFMFAVAGNYMGKVRSTFMFGLRTPWTLSSELAWNKTHRLGGYLMVLVGFELIIGGLVLNHPIVLFIGMGALILSMLFLVAYSYFVWKADPDKRTL